jgi:hypothetical protein
MPALQALRRQIRRARFRRALHRPGIDQARGTLATLAQDSAAPASANAPAQVYRHLLFNRLAPGSGSILRLGVLLLLFDVYLTWARVEKVADNAGVLAARALGLQYLFFLALVAASTLAFHGPIRALCSLPPPYALLPAPPHPSAISTALLVSSCTKLFPILLIIWDYDLRSAAEAVSWAVIVNNVAALEILMDCGYVKAGMLVGVGAGVRGVVEWGMLRGMGLGTGWEGFDGGNEVARWVERWML